MNKTVVCPYNQSHVVSADRIQYHLTKCRKKNKHMDLVICSYNATHHIPRSQETQHLRECPDQIFEDMNNYKFNEVPLHLQGCIPNPVKRGSDFIQPSSMIKLSSRPHVAETASHSSLATAKSGHFGLINRHKLQESKNFTAAYGKTAMMGNLALPKSDEL